MANSPFPPLPAAPAEQQGPPELMTQDLLPGVATQQPVDALQGYMRQLTESHMGIEEIARQFATDPQVTEAAQMALEGVRNLMQVIISRADLGVGDESVPIGG